MLDELRPGARQWWAVFAFVAVIYGMTASFDMRQNVDTFNTAVQAHQIAMTGSPVVGQLEYPDFLPSGQLREGRSGVVTDRHPGAVMAGVAGYVLARPLLLPASELDEFLDVPLWPAGLAAAITSAAAVATLAVALSAMSQLPRTAVWTAVTAFAFGTATWSISANALWSHTVTQLGLCLAIAGLASQRHIRSGLGFAIAVFARTHTALIAAMGGLAKGWERRQASPVVVIGLLSLMGLVAATAYGLVVYGGDPTLSVGRGAVADRLQHDAARTTGWGVGGNLALMLVHWERGLFPTTPFLIPLVLALPAAWREAPTWVRGLAVGGVAQVLVQGFINHYSGAQAFFGSRYTLELLTATFPLWVLAYVSTEHRPALRRWTHALGVVSIGMHAIGATVLSRGLLQ